MKPSELNREINMRAEAAREHEEAAKEKRLAMRAIMAAAEDSEGDLTVEETRKYKTLESEVARLAKLQAERLALCEEVRQAKSEIINRVGRKIRELRDSGKLTGPDFVAFRRSVYGQPEDDREAYVDDVRVQHGL